MTIWSRAANLFGRPEFLQAFHGWATLAWFIASTPLAISPLAQQVQFVTWLSLYAVVTGHWSSWQAARVEKKQDEELQQIIEEALEPIREELRRITRMLVPPDERDPDEAALVEHPDAHDAEWVDENGPAFLARYDDDE